MIDQRQNQGRNGQITFRNTAGHIFMHEHVGRLLARSRCATGRGVFTIEFERNT